MSGPVGSGPFPPDQPHIPVDLRRDGHFHDGTPPAAPHLEGKRFSKRIVFPVCSWGASLAALVYRRSQRADEGQVAIALGVVQAVAHDELVPDVEAGVGDLDVHP